VEGGWVGGVFIYGDESVFCALVGEFEFFDQGDEELEGGMCKYLAKF